MHWWEEQKSRKHPFKIRQQTIWIPYRAISAKWSVSGETAIV